MQPILLMILILGSTLFHISTARKNVLFILADDMRPEIAALRDNDSPSQMHDKMYTPHLDAFTEHSAVFRRAYVQQAICGPSRASFMTGRRPDTTRVYNLQDYFRRVGGNFSTIPQYFKERGYRTLGMGKIFHSGQSAGGNNDAPSWSSDETFFHSPSRRGYWNPIKKEHSWYSINTTLEREHPIGDQEVTDHAISVLQRLAPKAISGEENFFMAVGFYLPHLPFIFPERFLQYYPISDIKQPSNPYAPLNMPDYAWHSNGELLNGYGDIKSLNISGAPNTTWPSQLVLDLRRAYYASISYVDSLFGQIMTELDNLGLRNDTIVMFGSDHGWQLYEHTAWCKHTNFELATRTPLMFRAPGLTDQGIMSDHLVEYVDIYSTLVELADLPAAPLCPENPAAIQECTEGTSLVPIMKNSSLPGKPRVFMQYPRYRQFGRVMGYSMRTDKYRYTEWVRFNETGFGPDWTAQEAVELYDHTNDQEENVNRANDAEYASIVEQLKGHLHEGWRPVAN
ncbi:unnamed protein product [Owenia fusiformis]|uniref:Uncharacterized protein n=1 Tax=Owenia fusiformis TaxID=6347 RepID=A0A8J1Y8W4_OWEFU|nr:unnamed protein product [Owenia fusiformis]